MNEFTPIEKLDFVLEYLKRHAKTYPTENIQEEIFNISNIDKYEYQRILRHLAKDGYADILISQNEKITATQYIISFKGVVFHGYQKDRILDNETLANALVSENRIKSYEDRLLWATWTAGIVGALLLLWQIFLYFYPIHANYPYWIWQTIPRK